MTATNFKRFPKIWWLTGSHRTKASIQLLLIFIRLETTRFGYSRICSMKTKKEKKPSFVIPSETVFRMVFHQLEYQSIEKVYFLEKTIASISMHCNKSFISTSFFFEIYSWFNNACSGYCHCFSFYRTKSYNLSFDEGIEFEYPFSFQILTTHFFPGINIISF